MKVKIYHNSNLPRPYSSYSNVLFMSVKMFYDKNMNNRMKYMFFVFVCFLIFTELKTPMASEGACFPYFKRVTMNTAICWPNAWQPNLTLWSEDILTCKMKSILICFSASS